MRKYEVLFEIDKKEAPAASATQILVVFHDDTPADNVALGKNDV